MQVQIKLENGVIGYTRLATCSARATVDTQRMDFQLDLSPEDEHGIVQLRGGAKLKQAIKTNLNNSKQIPDENDTDNSTNKTSFNAEPANLQDNAQAENAPNSSAEQQ